MIRLESERLIIRPWTLEDVDDLYEYATDPEVGPSAGWKPHKDKAESESIVKMFMDSDETFAVVLKAENKVIGGVGIHRTIPDEQLKDKKQREVGYVLSQKYWGNGYIPEAVELLKAHCFQDLDIEILWCGHYDFNDKSKRVNEKCGFNYQFSTPQVLTLLDNREVIMLYYNIKRSEYFGEI